MPRRKKTACGCGGALRPGQNSCKACHAEHMREWRANHVYVKKESAAQGAEAERKQA